MKKGNIDPFTIIIVVLVLVFAFVLIYFSGVLSSKMDCKDVVHEVISSDTDKWMWNDADLRPTITNARYYPIDSQWMVRYQKGNGMWTTNFYPTLHALESDIDNLYLLEEEQRGQIEHIVDCINNDCEGCENI